MEKTVKKIRALARREQRRRVQQDSRRTPRENYQIALESSILDYYRTLAF